MKKLIYALVIVIVGLLLISRIDRTETTPGDNDDGETAAFLELQDNDNIKGNSESKVVLVEYGDFQCPACAAYQPAIKEVSAQFGDRVAFVFRHFPIQSIHPNALITARAAEAAGVQGKFWEMHDLMYENQADWSASLSAKPTLIEYATTLGLDIKQFEADLDNDDLLKKILEQQKAALTNKVSSTPTFFLNGIELSLPPDAASFAYALEQALATPAESEVEGEVQGAMTDGEAMETESHSDDAMMEDDSMKADASVTDTVDTNASMKSE